MLERNKRIKPAPERFQDCKERFDVVFSFEERVYDLVGALVFCSRVIRRLCADCRVYVNAARGRRPAGACDQHRRARQS
jgi:hypothetical protein